ncbi:MAG: mechanosensitive ion channel family protein [Cytophagales bacterium]|nr:mechanosensitive ion channel family protein [Cytophagales bacterium]
MKKLYFFLLIIVVSSATAQELDSVDLSSPYKSIWTHLYYLQPDTYNDSLAAQSFQPERRGLDRAKDLAIKLKQVLDGNGLFIYMDEVPKKVNYYDSIINKHKYVITEEYPDIYLRRSENSNDWVYADASMPAIDIAHENTFRFGTGALLQYLPKLGSTKILGLYLFQYIAILILALLSAIIYRAFTFLSERVLRKILIASGFSETSHKFLVPVARPMSFFIIIILLVLFVPVLQLPPDYSQYVILTLRILLPFIGTIIAFRFVNIFTHYLAKLAGRTESTLDDQLVPLIRKTLKTFVVVIGTLFILQNLNVPILPLLTGLSIGGLAFALAAQDTIKNFFGSLMIFIDKPFQIGDWVTTDGADGTVEEVGFRSSRIRTFANSLVYIPNGKLADSTIDNHGLRKYRRFFTKISLTYDTPPSLIQTYIEGLRRIVDNHPYTLKDNYHVYFNDMAASSLDVMFYIFFEVPTWGKELEARHEVLMEIMKLAEKLGVNFAFPTQTLHMENFPEKKSLSPDYMSEADMKMEMDEYFSSK